MNKTSTEIKRDWIRRTKQRMVDSMGGCCQICDYDKSVYGLDFHHIDPSKKKFAISSAVAQPRKWEIVVSELKKCVLLCSNCHRELHYGDTKLPESFATFDDSYENYTLSGKTTVINKCKCGKYKKQDSKFCSTKCVYKDQRKNNWNSIDLIKVLEETSIKSGRYNFSAAGGVLGVSDNAVRKWYKKITVP